MNHQNINKIINHHINQQIYDGTLPLVAFEYFLRQDELYLNDFAAALKVIANKLYNKQHQASINYIALNIIKSEQEHHQKYLGISHIPSFFNRDYNPQKIRSIKNYNNFIFDSANNQPPVVAIASCLPCFYLYEQLGQKMPAKALHSNNPYKKWIESYQSVSFKRATRDIIGIFEEYCQQPIDVDNVAYHFTTSIEHELNFLNEIHNYSTNFVTKKNNNLSSCNGIKLTRR